MASFRLEVPALTQGQLDRSEFVRDTETVRAHWPQARVLAVDEDSQLPLAATASRPQLFYLPAVEFGTEPPTGAVLLGALADQHYWAVSVGSGDLNRLLGDAAYLAGMRMIGPVLSDNEAALATTAVALIQWQQRAAFCARCAGPMTSSLTGHVRTCAQGHEEFPRTDPAVIVLVHDGAGNAILGRSPLWEAGRYSVLAGFTEAGESLETTVAREMREEVGVDVSDVEYLGSQPWPFPRSLMIAFAARAPKHAPLYPRPGEIEHADWFSRGQLLELLAKEADSPAQHTPGDIILPGRLSIARRMVEAFVAGT